MSINLHSKICEYCKKEFKTKHIAQKCCCSQCAGKLKTFRKPNKCSVCGKEFIRTKTKNRDGSRCENIFCSKECYLVNHTMKFKKLKCDGCGKEYIKQASKIRYEKNFCSTECTRKENRVLTCKVCGVDFCAIQYRKSNNDSGFTIIRTMRKTCSNECTIKMYKTDKVRKEKISIAFSGEKHPNYVNGCSKNGRVRKTDKKENMSLRQKREIFLKFSNKCFKCGSDEDLTLDHHLPFCMDGRLTESNSVVLCRSCNSSKNAKHPTKFYTQKELMALNKIGISHNNLFNFIF